MELKQFLEKVAGNTPTPGGGSASALAGALSASLVAMVAGLSSQKGGGKKATMEQIRKRALVIQKRLFRAIEEDARSFDAVIKAFRLPKGSEKERLHRGEKIQQAYQNATIPPQVVCQQSIQLLEYSSVLILQGNPNALSDAGVAALLADAAFSGGLLNIGVNLITVTNKNFIKKMNLLMRRWEKKKNILMKTILKKLTRTKQV